MNNDATDIIDRLIFNTINGNIKWKPHQNISGGILYKATKTINDFIISYRFYCDNYPSVSIIYWNKKTRKDISRHTLLYDSRIKHKYDQLKSVVISSIGRIPQDKKVFNNDVIIDNLIGKTESNKIEWVVISSFRSNGKIFKCHIPITKKKSISCILSSEIEIRPRDKASNHLSVFLEKNNYDRIKIKEIFMNDNKNIANLSRLVRFKTGEKYVDPYASERKKIRDLIGSIKNNLDNIHMDNKRKEYISSELNKLKKTNSNAFSYKEFYEIEEKVKVLMLSDDD